MPGMSASGNMIPQSTTRIRPSTSTQKQFRPISPSPPRKTIRTAIRRARYNGPVRGQAVRGRERAGSSLPACVPRSRASGAGRGGAVLGHLVEHRVLLAGVDPVLELDHAELGEALSQPA